MAPPSQIHLVGDVHDTTQAVSLQMIALLDHPTYFREALRAPRLASRQGETLEVRQDHPSEIAD